MAFYLVRESNGSRKKDLDLETPNFRMFAEILAYIFVFALFFAVVRSSPYNVNSVKIVFYYGPKYNDHRSYDLPNVTSILEHSKFIHNDTNLYMHGWIGSQDSYSVRLMVDAYLTRNSINFLAIDWKILASGTYLSAQRNVLKLAPRVADSILKLFDAGLDTLHLVGHSLGGLGVGAIAREVFNKSSGNVLLPRVTALDPSNPVAHDTIILQSVSKTDAKFVDVIHTDADGRCSLKSMGHAEFWPNGGEAVQPGCPSETANFLCSHLKAYAYWAQSVAKVDREQLVAYRAQNYSEFLDTGGENDTAVLMGVDCPTSAIGNYYLQIDSDYGAIPVIGLAL